MSATATASKCQLELFAEYLLEKEVIKPEVLRKVFTLQAGVDDRIGQLGIFKGYMKPQEVFATVTRQLEDDGLFGEEALKTEQLSERELKDMLAIQKNQFLMFLETLVYNRVIKKSRLKGFFKEFLQLYKDPAFRERTEGQRIVPMDILEHPEPKISPEELKSKLKEIQQLSSLPKVVQEVLSLLGNRETELREIAKVAELDVGLSSSMLRMVNSASMGMRMEVESIDQAVVILGFDGVRRLVLAASVISKFKTADSDMGRDIWSHSVLTGEWARALMNTRRGSDDEAEDAFTAGLLHDMGKFAILEYYPEAAETVRRSIRHGIPIQEAERRELGMSHPEIGGFLCHFWGFPESLAEAIAFHHAHPRILKKQKNTNPITNVVNISCRLANLEYHKSVQDGSVEVSLQGLDKEFLTYHQLDPAFITSKANEIYQQASESFTDLMS